MSRRGRSNTDRGGRGTESGLRKGGNESAAGVGSGSLVVKGGLDWAPQLRVLGNPGKPRGRNVGRQSILLAWGFLAFQKGQNSSSRARGILQGPRQHLAVFLYSQGTFDLSQLPTAESGWNWLFQKPSGLSSRGTEACQRVHHNTISHTWDCWPRTCELCLNHLDFFYFEMAIHYVA